MPVGAIIGGVASVAGGAMQAGAASSAADKQQQAADEARKLQYEMFQQQREDQGPWRQAGARALGQLADPAFQKDFSMTDFQQDPGYKFRMQQGQQAIERSAAARGMTQSGAQLKALAQYGQDLGAQEYQSAYDRFNADRTRRFNRLSSIAGLGQTANQQIGAAGQAYGKSAAGLMTGAANAQGAAGIAQANAWGGALGNIAKIGMQQWGS